MERRRDKKGRNFARYEKERRTDTKRRRDDDDDDSHFSKSRKVAQSHSFYDRNEPKKYSPTKRSFSRFRGDRFYINKQQRNEELREVHIPENAIIKFTKEELEIRGQHFSSTRSIFDRLKFEREFDVSKLKLSEEQQQLYNNNPHIRQVFANKRTFVKKQHPLTDSERYVDVAVPPPEKYKRRIGEAKTVDHWGQRKLLMSEIEFLTLHAKSTKKIIIIYAGAAPGNHTNYLSDMFPEISKWVLVDPAPFEAKETEKIEIVQDYFTDEMASFYYNHFPPSLYHVLFICDIRSMDTEMNDNEKEERVVIDMESQQKWVEIIRPRCAMLKFRLPYKPGITKYLNGRLYYPVWGGRTTSESRLFVFNTKYFRDDANCIHEHNETTKDKNSIDDVQSNTKPPLAIQGDYLILGNSIGMPLADDPKEPKTVFVNNCDDNSEDGEYLYRDYCHSWYEDVMFSFNTILRTSYFPHDVVGEGLDHCFDCSSEIQILRIYLLSHQGQIPMLLPNRGKKKNDNLEECDISKLSSSISKRISTSGRTLKLDSNYL